MNRTSGQQYLQKHVRYIDYRIQLLNNYAAANSIPDREYNDAVLDILISSDQFFSHSLLAGTEAEQLLRELKQLVRKWDIINDGDIVGYIYQTLQTRTTRKNKGQFFTPGDIVAHMASSALALSDNLQNIRILDPACGSGQFLITLFRILMEKYAHQGVAPKDAAERIIRHNLHGFDLDPSVIKIARYNLSRLSGIKPEDINITVHNFLTREQFCNNKISDRNLLNEKYDLIIGNPPWGSRVTADEKRYYKNHYVSSSSGINTFTLFIERSFELINPHGVVAFLIPEAYLNIRAHQSSREMILGRAAIKRLTIWGERFKGVFAPSISMIAQEEGSPESRSTNIVNIIHGAHLSSNTSILVPQDSYIRTPENIFNINYTRRCVNLLSTMENQDCLYLKDRSKFYLGIVTGNNTRHIYDYKSEGHPDPILLGKDVSQYRINFSNHYFSFNPGALQQVAPQHLYREKDKILYKFIGKRLTFALDRAGYYSLNNINGFIPDRNYREQINIESILSILNSDLMQYYYEKNYFTVKVLRGNLERLPIKKISASSQKRLKHLVEMIMNSSGEAEKKLRDTVEDIIYHEYGIRDREAFSISDGKSISE